MFVKSLFLIPSLTLCSHGMETYVDQPIPHLDLTRLKAVKLSKPKTPPGITRSKTSLKLGEADLLPRTRSLQNLRDDTIEHRELVLCPWQGIQSLYKELLSNNVGEAMLQQILKNLVSQEPLSQYHLLEIINTLLALKIAPHHLGNILKDVVRINSHEWPSLAPLMQEFFQDVTPITPLQAKQFLTALKLLPPNQWQIILYQVSNLCLHSKPIKSRLMALQKVTLLDERYLLAFLNLFVTHVNPRVSSSESSFKTNFDLWFMLAEQAPFALDNAFLGFSLLFAEDKEDKSVINSKVNERFISIYEELIYRYLASEKEDGEFRELWLTLINNTIEYTRDSGHGWQAKVSVLDLLKDIPMLRRELLIKLMKTLNAKIGPLRKCHFSILQALKDIRVEFWQGEFEYVAFLLSDQQSTEINGFALGRLFEEISRLTLSEREPIINMTKSLITQCSPSITFHTQDIVSLLMMFKKIKPSNRKPSLTFLLSQQGQPGFSKKNEVWRFLTKVSLLKNPWSKETETYLTAKLKGK